MYDRIFMRIETLQFENKIKQLLIQGLQDLKWNES